VPALGNAQVVFDGLDLSPANTLLFKARVSSPGYGAYDTLFKADVEKGSLSQLTFFPERAVLLSMSDQLQIQNRFGVFRSDKDLSTITPIQQFPSFVGGKQIATGKINPVGSSPDGKYLLSLVPKSNSFADLTLFDVAGQKETVIATDVELSLVGPGASWSPDSRFFVYEKGESLYYYSIEQMNEKRVLAENFRYLSSGKINSAVWSSKNDLYIISGSLVYQILSAEFFARTLYQELLQVGKIVGKIPFPFDPNFDSFMVSPDGNKILLNKEGRNLFLFFLTVDDYVSAGSIKSLPYLCLPRNTTVEDILWSADDVITVLTSSREQGDVTTSVFRLALSLEDKAIAFTQMPDEGIRKLSLSENQRYVAALKKDSVLIKEYASWRDILSYPYDGPIDALWKSSNECIITGTYFTELLDIDRKSGRLICLSQPEGYGHSGSGAVQIRNRGKVYEADASGKLTIVPAFSVGEAATASSAYRVYLETLPSGAYQNLIMVRNIAGYGTKPLFGYPGRAYEPFPKDEEPVDMVNFSHGSRIRRREVSLVFNAIDSVEGLTEILNVLSEYRLKATFFVNGDFIRRNPEATREIAESGHEVGSLFYVHFNMTDSRFKIDEEFIKRGLARNEDEYFAVTGRELSLLWHAPYYFVNTDIINASKQMNYVYIGRDVDPLDWVPFRNCEGSLYFSSKDIVERIIRLKKPGSIIPIRIGKPEEGRKDYLFQDLDLVINALLTSGYEIVPVSALIEHAK